VGCVGQAVGILDRKGIANRIILANFTIQYTRNGVFQGIPAWRQC